MVKMRKEMVTKMVANLRVRMRLKMEEDWL
jgi:hypothetical protein